MKRFFVVGIALIALLTGCGNNKEKSDQASYRQYGINCIESGEYDKAVEAFDKALSYSSYMVTDMELDLCYYKAEAFFLNGNYDKAASVYKSIIEYNKDSQAYYLRGCLYFKTGQSQLALNDFAMANRVDKDNYDLLINIYQAMADNGYEHDGQYYLEEGLKISGKKATDYLNKGRIYLLLKDTNNAQIYLKKALEKNCLKANFYLGEVCEATGDTVSADTYYASYLNSNEATSDELAFLGERAMESGEYETAIEYFQKGLESDTISNEMTLMKDEAVAYERIGKFDKAKEILTEYLKKYPNDAEAIREVTFLETR